MTFPDDVYLPQKASGFIFMWDEKKTKTNRTVIELDEMRIVIRDDYRTRSTPNERCTQFPTVKVLIEFREHSQIHTLPV